MRGHGVRIKTVGPITGPLGRHPGLRRAVKLAVEAADIVHIHGMWEQIQHYAASAARRNGTPYLIRPCGMLDPWSLNQGRLKKQLALMWRVKKNLNHAAGIHFTTQAECDVAAPLNLTSTSYVVPNGVPPDVLSRDLFDAASRTEDAPPHIHFMSRLHHKKGVDLLIRAVGELHRRPHSELYQAQLALAGPDEAGYINLLRQIVTKENLVHHCRFAGLVEGPDKRQFLADGDLFCLPSHQENFGLVVVEALACGLPVVVSPHVNIVEEIVQAQVGISCPMKPAGIADALEEAWRLFPRSNRAVFRRRAHDWVVNRYSWASVSTKLSKIYAVISQEGLS